VKYADGLVLPHKEEAVLQTMIERLLKLEKVMEWISMWKKTKMMRISRQLSPIQIMVDKIIWRMWNVSAVWVTR